MSSWTHMATGILLIVPAIVATLIVAARTLGAVKPAYPVVDARRSMRDSANAAGTPVPSFNCQSRGISR